MEKAANSVVGGVRLVSSSFSSPRPAWEVPVLLRWVLGLLCPLSEDVYLGPSACGAAVPLRSDRGGSLGWGSQRAWSHNR